MDLLLKNANLYRDNHFEDVDILVSDGYIKEIRPHIEATDEVIDLKGKLVCHNFIDMHVHLREPGLEYKETIDQGSLSALYGGYGTIVAMANTLPVMDNTDTINDFKQRVEKDGHVNVYTYSAITKGLAGKELVDMERNYKEDIVVGFSDDGKGVQSASMMDQAMQKAKEIDAILVCHCEDERELHGGCIHEGQYAKEHHLVGINSASEYNEVDRDLNMVRKYHTRYHVCHVSTKETVELLRQAKKENLPVSGEACPHHLILCDEDIKDCHPNYKMNPPLRAREDREALIQGLNDHTITVISTDHAPHSREEKHQPIEKAPFGIIGNQHAFSLLYTHLVKENLVDLKTILNGLTTGPAHVLKMNVDVKAGSLANLCIFDLDKKYMIKEEDIKSKGHNTPFIGEEVYGKIYANIINGKMVRMEEDE